MLKSLGLPTWLLSESLWKWFSGFSIFWLHHLIYFYHNLILCLNQQRDVCSCTRVEVLPTRPDLQKQVLFSYQKSYSEGPQDRDWYSYALSQVWNLKKINGFFISASSLGKLEPGRLSEYIWNFKFNLQTQTFKELDELLKNKSQ